MLARRRNVRKTAPVRGFTLALLVLLAAPLFASLPSRADIPTTTDNGNASTTVTWNMTDTSGYSAINNVTLASGHAALPWRPDSLSLARPSDFIENGTLDPGVAANATGIYLWGNSTNHLVNGDFGRPAGWNYTNGTTGNVTARWDPASDSAELQHVSASGERSWDGMDNVLTGWALRPVLTIGQMYEVRPAYAQGTGMMGINATGWGSSYSYLGALNLSPTAFDWSSFNRLVLWIRMNLSLPIGFNVTANVGLSGRTVSTSNESLVAGWQEVAVDLDQLGSPANRSQLTQVTLRFNGRGVPAGTWFYIDDVRLAVARASQGGASASQMFMKANGTTPLPGSALLSFDWNLASAVLGNTTGLANYTAAVNLTAGPGSSYQALLRAAAPGVWRSFAADVSQSTAARGMYNLSFLLWVQGNITGPANVTVLIDNVSLVFPDRQNASFTSHALGMGSASAFLNLSWAADIPGNTSITLGIRTGNNTNPDSGSWSHWQLFSKPGTCSLTVPGASYFQLRANLSTTNASLTPFLTSVSVSAQHRLSAGSLVSEVFPAPATDFLNWTTFNASLSEPALTAVAFFVGNGTSWTKVTPGASVAFIRSPQFQWKAVLTSSDGLVTPSLENVRVTYAYLGKPVRVAVTLSGGPVPDGTVVNVTLGQYAEFRATAYDVGSHPLPASLAPLVWQSTDTKGVLFPNGTYFAGTPGLHIITVSVGSPPVYATIRVNVSGSLGPTGGSLWDLWPVYTIGIAAALGFAVYELVIRRMFAIDDVFLIAKDGRLLMHNTRRMRADRDEDILSGMLTAIMAFLRDQDPEENGELKQFQVGGKTTLLERGKHAYLAVMYSGRVPGWAGKDLHRFMVDLEGRFGDRFAHWDGSPEDLHGLKEFMGNFVTRVRYHGGRGGPSPSD